jgi:hypothetical protein
MTAPVPDITSPLHTREKEENEKETGSMPFTFYQENINFLRAALTKTPDLNLIVTWQQHSYRGR